MIGYISVVENTIGRALILDNVKHSLLREGCEIQILVD
jgi:hypothetical protein